MLIRRLAPQRLLKIKVFLKFFSVHFEGPIGPQLCSKKIITKITLILSMAPKWHFFKFYSTMCTVLLCWNIREILSQWQQKYGTIISVEYSIPTTSLTIVCTMYVTTKGVQKWMKKVMSIFTVDLCTIFQ